MPESVNTATPTTPIAESDSLDFGTVIKSAMSLNIAAMSNDLTLSSRSHERYLEVMDRVFLADYTEEASSIEKRVAGLGAASHVPVSQPWFPPFVQPAGS